MGWSDAIGQLGAATIGFLGGERQNSSAKSAAREANEHNIRNYKHRYQWQVEDLKKAGLNPLLAVSQGAGSVAGAPSAQTPSNSGEAAVNSALQAKRLSAEVNLLEQQASKAAAETEGIRSENVPRSIREAVWRDFLGPAARNAVGSARAFSRMADSAGNLAGAYGRKAAKKVRHFGTKVDLPLIGHKGNWKYRKYDSKKGK